jgi:hypothetical protein
MDTRQFDRIARFLAERRLSRRRAVATGGTGLVAGAALTAGLAPAASASRQATPVAAEDIELLYLQSFASGALTPADGGTGAYTLTLDDGLGETVYFSDRPNRVVGAMPTADFVAAFEAAADDPPNAALVAGDMTLVMELTSTSFDQAAGTLTYQATVLGEDEAGAAYVSPLSEPPTVEMALESCHLFIDAFDPCCDPVHRPWCC